MKMNNYNDPNLSPLPVEILPLNFSNLYNRRIKEEKQYVQSLSNDYDDISEELEHEPVPKQHNVLVRNCLFYK